MMEMLALPMRCLLDTLPFVTHDKKGEQFWFVRVVILRGRVSIGHFVRGSVNMRNVVRITCIFSFFSYIDTFFLYFRSCDHFLHSLYLSSLYIFMYVLLSPTLYICCFFSLFMHMRLITCMQFIIYVSHKNALMSFV